MKLSKILLNGCIPMLNGIYQIAHKVVIDAIGCEYWGVRGKFPYDCERPYKSIN